MEQAPAAQELYTSKRFIDELIACFPPNCKFGRTTETVTLVCHRAILITVHGEPVFGNRWRVTITARNQPASFVYDLEPFGASVAAVLDTTMDHIATLSVGV